MTKIQEPFENLLEALVEPEGPVQAALIYRLSDPDQVEFVAFKAVWPDVPIERKRLLLSRLVETSEVSFEVNFRDVAMFALNDDDDRVRQHAVEILWEEMDPALMNVLIRTLQNDPAENVRAAAAQSLGRFVLAGELGDIDPQHQQHVETALLDILLAGDETLLVHRRALESLSYSGREEVISLIEEAQTHTSSQMRASAIFAMGRSADERWADDVLRALHHPEPELRYEAARASGELTLKSALPTLVDMVHGNDREIQMQAIWALGEIGGQQAQQALLTAAERAEAQDDRDLLDAIEDAMNMAVLTTGDFVTYLFGLDEDDEDGLAGLLGDPLDNDSLG